jgi:hypothetical protein
MAQNRAILTLRRRFSLGFSKCRWLRASFSVPSRSRRFFNRRNARSTGSPFFSLISVNPFSHPLQNSAPPGLAAGRRFLSQAQNLVLPGRPVNGQNRAELRSQGRSKVELAE